MQQVIIKNTATPPRGAEILVGYLNESLLRGKNTLWFISGGSSIPIAREAIAGLKNTTQLRVMIVDDKFIPVTNTDGVNRQGLLCGVALRGVDVRSPSYTGRIHQDAKEYAKQVAESLEWAEITIGQFGIGEGFHTGGIIPDMPDISESDELAEGYVINDVASVTITPKCIEGMDIVFVNSFGESKRELVNHFLESDACVTAEPAQALKGAKKTVLVTDVLLT